MIPITLIRPSENRESATGPAKSEVSGPKPPVYKDIATANKNATITDADTDGVIHACYAEWKRMGEVG